MGIEGERSSFSTCYGVLLLAVNISEYLRRVLEDLPHQFIQVAVLLFVFYGFAAIVSVLCLVRLDGIRCVDA